MTIFKHLINEEIYEVKIDLFWTLHGDFKGETIKIGESGSWRFAWHVFQY
jgi:hypothetical protein